MLFNTIHLVYFLDREYYMFYSDVINQRIGRLNTITSVVLHLDGLIK